LLKGAVCSPYRRWSSTSAELLAIDPRFAQREGCDPVVGETFGVRQWVLGDLLYGLVAAAVWLLLPAGHPVEPPAAIAAIAVFIVAAHVSVPLNVGGAQLTQSAFVLMLFALPLNTVPVIAGLCVLAGGVLRRKPVSWLVLTPGDCWYVVPPTLIIALAAPGPASWSHWPVYTAAFAAQFGFHAAVGAGRRALPGHRGEFDVGTVLTPVVVDMCLSPSDLPQQCARIRHQAQPSRC
jgi:hypothetical protein